MSAANLWTNITAGTASYPTGGFVITTTLSTLAAFDADVNVPGALGQVHFVVTLNSPGAGQAKVKVMRDTFQKLSFGSPTGLPSGVTSQTSGGQTYTAESAHTMDLTHGHTVSAASAAMAGASGQVTQAVTGGVNTSTHTHTVTIASEAFTTGAGSSHTHTNDNIYQHQHAFTNTGTDVSLVELANGTDLSGVTFNYMGVDA